MTGLDVVTGGYTSDDLANAGNTGLCQTCHATSGGAGSYTRSLFTPLASHNGASGTLCTGCHTHPNDFAPESCESCHNEHAVREGVGDGAERDGRRAARRHRRADAEAVRRRDLRVQRQRPRPRRHPGVPATRSTSPAPPATTSTQPPGTHLNGTLNGRLTPRTPGPPTRSTCSPAYVKAAPTSEQDVQVTFDNVCATLATGRAPTCGTRPRCPAPNAPSSARTARTRSREHAAADMFYDRNLKSADATVRRGDELRALRELPQPARDERRQSPRGSEQQDDAVQLVQPVDAVRAVPPLTEMG